MFSTGRIVLQVIGSAAAITVGCAGIVANHTQETIHEKLVVQDPNSDKGNQFTVEDKNKAPMLWTNYAGTQSAEPYCIISEQLKPVICFGGKLGDIIVSPEIVFYNSQGKVKRIWTMKLR